MYCELFAVDDFVHTTGNMLKHLLTFSVQLYLASARYVSCESWFQCGYFSINRLTVPVQIIAVVGVREFRVGDCGALCLLFS